MRLVLVYDVVDDRRRARLFRRLQRWLTSVQRSVFEGDVSQVQPLRDLIQAELDLHVDDARIYRLCAGCAGQVEHFGVAVAVPDPHVPIVV